MDPKKNRGNLKALPYAVWEGDCWFAAIKFELRDAPIGQDVILRKIPCLTPDEAMQVARQHIAGPYR